MRLVFKIICKVLIVIVVLLGLIQLYLITPLKEQPLRTNQLKKGYNYSDTPTLLIPGWAGNRLTYQAMVKSFQKENLAQKTMTIHVRPNGKIVVDGTVKNKKNALIQVLFDWNYTSSFRPQTRWLTDVMEVLHEQYHVDKLNIVSHSWGGSAWIHALAGSPKIQKEIQFKKVILLGVPVEESFDDSTTYRLASQKHSTDGNFHKLIAQARHFDLKNKIHFYNFLGEIKNKPTDGSVPNVQSEFLKKIINPKWAYYQQQTFKNTSHSSLHDNKRILSEISDILWKNK